MSDADMVLLFVKLFGRATGVDGVLASEPDVELCRLRRSLREGKRKIEEMFFWRVKALVSVCINQIGV